MKLLSFKSIGTLLWMLCFTAGIALADSSKDFPPRPSPPRLVNDMAGLMTPAQQDELEQLLVGFDRTASTQITIVTIKSLGDYEPSEYATQLGQLWGVGRKEKNNGVVVLVAADDRKMNISPGYGLEGALTDAMCGRIIRNEMAPEFKAGNYYKGLDNAAKAIIAATKGEYTNEDQPGSGGGALPFIIFVIIFIVIIIMAVIRRGGGGGGGNYMSRRGGDFITGAILGSIFSGGGNSGGSGWGGGSSSGGGFGGFGGGSFGGGGASGSW